jgi:hypothetical protein
MTASGGHADSCRDAGVALVELDSVCKDGCFNTSPDFLRSASRSWPWGYGLALTGRAAVPNEPLVNRTVRIGFAAVNGLGPSKVSAPASLPVVVERTFCRSYYVARVMAIPREVKAGKFTCAMPIELGFRYTNSQVSLFNFHPPISS